MKKLLLLFVTAIVTTMAAQAATYYGFKIGGVEVNSDNYQNVTGSNISGKVVYDPDTKTVTLTNVTIARTGKDNRAIFNEYRPQLTVVLQGTCNLSATESAPLRFERHTTIVVPEGSKATITGGSEGGIYLTNSTALTLKGYGTINITADSKGGIEGSTDSNKISFQEGIKATIAGGGGDLLDIWRVAFCDNSKVTLKATYNGKPNVNNVDLFVLLDDHVVLEPLGAAYNQEAESVVLNGNNVSNQDILVSNDYVALINSTYFPDANFRKCLLELFPKGYLTQADIDATTSLDVKKKSISTLAGIKYFTALTNLNCSDNSLSALYLDSCPNLTTLDCSYNQLTSLILDYNKKLKYLYCQDNKLTTLDLSKNTSLSVLYCYFNNINGSGAEAFVNKLPHRSSSGTIRFFVENALVNGVSKLDNNLLLREQVQAANEKNWYLTYTSVSTANPWYEYIGELLVNETNFPDQQFRDWVVNNADTNGNGYLSQSELRVISISVNSKNIASLQGIEYFTSLRALYCENNKLTTLDLSKNTDLSTLYCYNNKITDDGAQNFVDKLPIKENGNIRFKYGVNDVNSLTVEQAQTVKDKKWDLRWLKDGYWVPFYGHSDYPIAVCGVQVTSDNRDGITGEGITGTITYDPEANVLTLDNATITAATANAIRVEADLPGLNIKLVGENTITMTNPGKIAVNIFNSDGAVIEGPGKLHFNNASAAIYLSSGPGSGDHRATIRNCEISANDPTTYSPSGTSIQEDDGDANLTIENATVRLAKGNISCGYDLQLVDCYISKPEGGHIDGGSVCAAGSNSYFTGEIVILPTSQTIAGDVDGSDIVDVDDVNAIINIILGKKPASEYTGVADVDGSGIVDVDDVNAVINIILNK